MTAMRSVTGPLKRTSRAVAVATAAIAAGGGAAVLATSSSAPAQAAEQVQVQAYAVPAADYSAPGSAELPLTPAPGGGSEWLIVSGAAGGSLLDEPATGGTPTVVGSNLGNLNDGKGSEPFRSLADADGYAWADAYGGDIVGFESSGALAPLPAVVAVYPFTAPDMTADASGRLYIPDHNKSFIAQALIGSSLKSTTGNAWTVPTSFSSTDPDAVAVLGNDLWFTTDSGQLGSIDISNGNSDVVGPYPAQANGNGHTLAAGADGDLWTVGGGQSGSGGSQIVRIDPSCGGIVATYSTGLDPNPQITAITSGPDGNIWFTESGANAIGELDIATGAIANFPLPAGFELPAAGSDVIALGPASTGTVFFGAEAAGAPAVGVISGLATSASVTTAPSGCSSSTTTTGTTTTTTTGTTTTKTTTTTKSATTTGRPSVARSAKVSSKGVTRIAIKCTGEAACLGKLVLELIRTEKVKVKHKTVRKRVTTTIGSARFTVKAGHTGDVSIHLARVAVVAVAGASHHRLSVTAKLEPAGAKARTSSVSLIGQTTPKR